MNNTVKNDQNFTTPQPIGKYDNDIDALKYIVQYGVGIERTDAALDIMLDKVSGKLPYGADSSEFSTRKRLVLLQLRGDFVYAALIVFICSILTLFSIGFVVYSEWYFGIATVFFSSLIYFNFKRFSRSKALYSAIKPLQQTVPDIEKTHIIVNEAEMAQMFAKDRLKTRLISIVMMILCGGLCYSIYYGTSDRIPRISLLLPCGFMMFLGTFITGINKPELFHRRGYAQARWKDLPIILKICTVLGVIASIASLAWVKGLLVF
ncbi:hypothetical protein [Acinetobacter boissieri]|uniref:Uncharacterized protein n=1 Tax=Acinetobacter boissieri TaxID=1219383 RepID=A0A1G6GIZ5_9GAMM|nr:hypothetical protein [Acinetobacter boissieri]SDB81156.1 hypothetical protein SAMN05421733_10189 [Acinetobacter boissieri]